MSRPRRYDQIDFRPTQLAAENAEKGLRLRRHFDRGGTEVGVARARDIKNRERLSPDTIQRMTSYFARHAVDKDAEGFGDDENASAGYIAWLLWGGDEGRDWAQSVRRKMDEADKENA